MELIIKDTVTAVLEKLGAKLKHPKPILEAAGFAVANLAKASFGDPSVRAETWAPLSKFTLAQKMAEDTSSSILRRHGQLAKSFRITGIGDDFVRVGTDRPHAHVHQFGMVIRAKSALRGLVFRAGHFGLIKLQSVTIPMRPMLPLIGSRESFSLTPLAVRNVVSAAKAELARILGSST